VLCNYPNCRYPERFIPVITIPTVRTGGMTDKLVETSEPTILTGKSICRLHKDTYRLSDWVKPIEWGRMKEAARARGLELRTVIITLSFRPVGWEPKKWYMKMERD